MKILTVIILGFVLLGCVSSVYGQYSRWEIEAAIEYLQKRQILDNLIKLTEADRAKLTSRPDVLIACYEIMREIDRHNAGFKGDISRLEAGLNNLKVAMIAPSSQNNGDDELVRKVLNEVEANLDNFRNMVKLKSELTTINELIADTNKKLVDTNAKVSQLSDQIQHFAPTDAKQLAQVNRKANQSRIIAAGSVLMTVLMALLVAI